jgi:CheY-like chemotaxis protein
MTKILIVEDNDINRDMLARRLRRYGFSICVAVDGPTGIAMASQEMPDIILMDIVLRDMDGWEATRLIKANPQTAHIPIVALTAQAQENAREISLRAGCREFDTMPVDLLRLLEKIRDCLADATEGTRASPPSDNASQ